MYVGIVPTTEAVEIIPKWANAATVPACMSIARLRMTRAARRVAGFSFFHLSPTLGDPPHKHRSMAVDSGQWRVEKIGGIIKRNFPVAPKPREPRELPVICCSLPA